MDEIEQQAADTVISRMEFLEAVLVAAQYHWNVVEYNVVRGEAAFIGAHERLGELLKQNREADDAL